MAKSDVKLLGAWASPFSIKVQMALNLKCVDYEFMEEDLNNKSQRLIDANPIHEKIPVLIHGERSICESLIIVQYVDDVWTTKCSPLLPSNPYDRAMARFWAVYVDEKLSPSMKALLLSDGKNRAALEEINQMMSLLENTFINCSKGQNFFGGDKVGYLDIALGSYLGYIRVLEIMGQAHLIGGPNTPNLFKWAQNFCAVDAVKGVVPDTDKLLEFAKGYAARVKKN